MSAAGRTSDLRTPADAYMTPPWCVDRILERLLLLSFKKDGLFPDTVPPFPKPAYWLDPCAGNGQLIRATQAHFTQAGLPLPRWQAVEIRPECEAALQAVANPVIISDFLRVVPSRYEVVLTNPPYSLAEEFVRACVPIADNVVMLLRLNWIENRDELLKAHPADIYVLPNRPSFGRDKRGKIGTDATAYAWMHWHAGATGKIEHLARTPKAVRSAYKKWLDKTLPRRSDARADAGGPEQADVERGEPGPEVLAPEAADGQQPVVTGVPSVEPPTQSDAAGPLDGGSAAWALGEPAGAESFGGEDFPAPRDLLDGPLRYR